MDIQALGERIVATELQTMAKALSQTHLQCVVTAVGIRQGVARVRNGVICPYDSGRKRPPDCSVRRGGGSSSYAATCTIPTILGRKESASALQIRKR